MDAVFCLCFSISSGFGSFYLLVSVKRRRVTERAVDRPTQLQTGQTSKLPSLHFRPIQSRELEELGCVAFSQRTRPGGFLPQAGHGSPPRTSSCKPGAGTCSSVTDWCSRGLTWCKPCSMATNLYWGSKQSWLVKK